VYVIELTVRSLSSRSQLLSTPRAGWGGRGKKREKQGKGGPKPGPRLYSSHPVFNVYATLACFHRASRFRSRWKKGKKEEKKRTLRRLAQGVGDHSGHHLAIFAREIRTRVETPPSRGERGEGKEKRKGEGEKAVELRDGYIPLPRQGCGRLSDNISVSYLPPEIVGGKGKREGGGIDRPRTSRSSAAKAILVVSLSFSLASADATGGGGGKKEKKKGKGARPMRTPNGCGCTRTPTRLWQ